MRVCVTLEIPGLDKKCLCMYNKDLSISMLCIFKKRVCSALIVVLLEKEGIGLTIFTEDMLCI